MRWKSRSRLKCRCRSTPSGDSLRQLAAVAARGTYSALCKALHKADKLSLSRGLTEKCLFGRVFTKMYS